MITRQTWEEVEGADLAALDRVFRRHLWDVRAFMRDGNVGLKLGPVTLSAYRYIDDHWCLSFCAMNRERFVWPRLSDHAG